MRLLLDTHSFLWFIIGSERLSAAARKQIEDPTNQPLLSIALDHLATVARLPFHHRDPFDRLLIAQALVEQMPIVSADSEFDAYGIERLW